MISNKTPASGLLICLVTLFVTPLTGAVVAGEPTDQKILGLRPPGAHVCLAVEIKHESGEAMSGIRWLHNDDTVAFPRLLLIEGQEGKTPNLADTGLILYELIGDAVGWGEAQLDYPVQSSTGLIYAVFVYPANVPTTGVGTGTGPGIGINQTSQEAPFFISHDGMEWIEFSSDYSLVVDPVLTGVGKAGQETLKLSELAESINYWALVKSEPELPPVERTHLYPGFPNPFNPRVTIAFDVGRPGKVSLRLYDVRGRLVHTLVEQRYPRGRYQEVWEGRDDRGARVASGVYYLQMKAPGAEMQQKLTLIR